MGFGPVIGGEVLTSLISSKPLAGVDMLDLVAANSSRLTGGAFFNLMMGISLVAMTVFLYPIFRKDSKELAMGMVLFRGALEGTGYFAYDPRYFDTSRAWQRIHCHRGRFGCFAVHGQCLVSVPRPPRPGQFHHFSHWGYVFIPLLLPHPADPPLVVRLGLDRRGSLYGFALLHFFHLDTGYGFYLEMVMAPQEMVMAVWLIVKGFNPSAIAALSAKRE